MCLHRCPVAFLAFAMSLQLLHGASAAAQDRPASGQGKPFTMTVNASSVTLDVVVTDKRGHPVANIPKSAFEIYDNNLPQQVNYFQPHVPGSLLEPAAASRKAGLDQGSSDGPVMIIVVDEVNTRFEDEAFAMASLQGFLSKQGETLSQPTMLLVATLERLKVVSDATTSKQQLLTSLKGFRNEYPWPTRSNNLVAEQVNTTLSAIVAAAESTMGHPGRKTVVWIGRGFPAITPGSLDPASAASLQDALRTCIDLMMQTRMTLYTIDPNGLSVNPTTDDTGQFSSDPLDGQIDFSSLAKGTGGKAFAGRNDVDKLVEICAREADDFYTLAYTPASSVTREDRRFHSIRVIMTNPDWKATTRQGYYTESPMLASDGGSSSGEGEQRLLYDLDLAARTTMAFDGVPIQISRSSSESGLFTIAIPNSAIRWQDASNGQQSADIYLLAESFDKDDKLIHHTAKLVTAKLTAASTVPSVNILVEIPTNRPAVRLRFAVVLGATGKVGAANFMLPAEDRER